MARGRPCFTPASPSDSRNIAANAGPQPAMELAVESSLPSTHSMSAIRPNRFSNASSSSSVSEWRCSQAITPAPTAMGVLGMVLRWRLFGARTPS